MKSSIEEGNIQRILQVLCSCELWMVSKENDLKLFIKNGPISKSFWILTQLVNTLDAALLKWKLRTLLMESAHKVNTYNSPPLSDITNLSKSMNATWAASRLIVTSLWGSKNCFFNDLMQHCYRHRSSYLMENWCYDLLYNLDWRHTVEHFDLNKSMHYVT